MRIAWILILGACSGAQQGPGIFRSQDYVPPDGRELTYAAPDDTGGTALLVHVDQGWDVRTGFADDWDNATEISTFDVTTKNGLDVGGDVLLPHLISLGERVPGLKVVQIDYEHAWYGTFKDTVVVQIDAGRWQGEQMFAPKIGPIELTLDGATWTLTTYK